MKKLTLVFALVIGILILIFFLNSYETKKSVRKKLISTNIKAPYGYSYLELKDLSVDIKESIKYTSLTNRQRLWSGYPIEFDIDFIKNIVTLKYAIQRPVNSSDIFNIEKLTIQNLIIEDNNVTFDITSTKFGVIKCLYFINENNGIKMIVNINNIFDKEYQSIMFRAKEQII